MSFPELLDAVKALPRAEQLQLIHALVDEVGGGATTTDEIPEHLRHLLPPPGAVVSAGYQITAFPAGGPDRPTSDELVARYFPPGVTYEVISPVFAPEAAAVLADLLKAEKANRPA